MRAGACGCRTDSTAFHHWLPDGAKRSRAGAQRTTGRAAHPLCGPQGSSRSRRRSPARTGHRSFNICRAKVGGTDLHGLVVSPGFYQDAGFRMPNFFMREASVVGLSSKSSAAPPEL